MTRASNTAQVLATVLVAVMLAAVLVPLCTMSECANMGAGGCSGYKSACGDCPTPTVMKHASNDAVQLDIPSFGAQAVLALLPPSAEPPAVGRSLPAPVVTASPPPLNPLGVRLTL